MCYFFVKKKFVKLDYYIMNLLGFPFYLVLKNNIIFGLKTKSEALKINLRVKIKFELRKRIVFVYLLYYHNSPLNKV